MAHAIAKTVFVGSKAMGLKCLKAMHAANPETLVGIITVNDQDDARSALTQFEKFSEESHVPLVTAGNHKEFADCIEKLSPELCIVVGWYRLIPAEILRCVPRGFIGIHNSLLPRYRGGSPLIWAMINGENEVGLSLFVISEGMDDGEVIAQASVTVGERDTIADVLSALESKAELIIKTHYPLIIKGKARLIPQDHAQATYGAQRIPDDGLIAWDKPGAYIYNFIRAQTKPYPGAFTYYNSEKLIIWSAELLPEKYFGTPGQVVRVLPGGVVVMGGDSSPLLIKDVSRGNQEGKADRFITSFNARFSRQENLARWVGVAKGSNVRSAAFVNAYGCKIGDNSKIGAFVEIQKNAVIGRNCKISSHSFICEGVTIADNVFVGHNVTFINDKFPHAVNDDGSMQVGGDWRPLATTVEKNASIGSGSTILCGVTIGEGALVGAGSVVTRDVPAGAVVAGNPARILRNDAK